MLCIGTEISQLTWGAGMPLHHNWYMSPTRVSWLLNRVIVANRPFGVFSARLLSLVVAD